MSKNGMGSQENGSEVSSSSRRKSSRRHEDDGDSHVSRRSRNDSMVSSSSKRKLSRRESTDQSGNFHPNSSSYSSSSRAPYTDVAAPSVASSYQTAYTGQTNPPMDRPEVVRNESMADNASRTDISSASRRDSRRESRSDVGQSRGVRDDQITARSDESRRDSKRSSRKESAARAVDGHEQSLPSNQFPGQEPAGFNVDPPYRPPGLASDYYGDGEHIEDQPGVRIDRPSVLISADQAHLWEPSIEANPPPEPSSMGQVGAAASFFGGGSDMEQGGSTTPPRPSNAGSTRPPRRQSLMPGKDSTAHGASPRSSPGPDPGRRPLPQSNNSESIGRMGSGAAPLASSAMAAGVGAAAEYFTGNIEITPHDQPLSSGIPGQDNIIPGVARPSATSGSGNQGQMQSTTSTGGSAAQAPRPSQSSGSNMPLYGAAAAAAAGVAGAAYLAHGHTSAQHEQFVQSPTEYHGRPTEMAFRPGNNQTQASFSGGHGQKQRMRQKRKGPFGKIIDWFQDPAAVAEYEAYTEAIGVCKYCFDPGSTPADAPRRHHYRRRRPSSGSRYGSSTRVDKLTRYSSDENLRRRNSKKGHTTTEKVIATGLAGVGAAAVANEVYKHKNDFDDTYSVKSGRPAMRSRVSFREDEEERYSTSKRKSRRQSEGDRQRQSASEGEIQYEKRSSRRRDSSGSDNRETSRGGNLSTPVALAGAAAVGAAMSASGSRRRSRSRSKSPRKNRKGYYSKRVSPRHSYVDLNQTTLVDSPTGPLGLGGFFSSPSSNSKKGKKPKGLFNFNNGSSSSSDADLAFGEGTVKRKEKRGRKADRQSEKRQSGMGETAAILGLAATGAALAAESSRRDEKGKSRADSNRQDDDRSRKSKRESSNKIKLQQYEDSADNGDEGVWEDASDDDKDSVDSALAYGGRLSSRQSKESLKDSSNILGWRFGGNQKPKEEEKKARRRSSKLDLSGYDPVKAGLIAGATGLAGAAVADHYSRPSGTTVASPPKDMPPLQYIDPMPLQSGEQTPRKFSTLTSVSPMSFPPPVTRTSDANLEHPQPIVPISPEVYHARQSYTDLSGPVIFDKPRSDSQSQTSGIMTAAALGAAAVAINESEHERKQDHRRSATMPTVVPALKESVSFDLTQEQQEKEIRRERKRRERETRKAEETAAAARESRSNTSIITGPDRSPERKLETWRLRDAVKAGGPGSMQPPIRDPSPDKSRDLSGTQTQPLGTPERETRLSEIDRQLEELYAQHREQEAKKKKQMEATGFAAATAAVAVGVAAATSSSRTQDEKPRRKSSLRKTSKYRDQDVDTESAVSSRSAPTVVNVTPEAERETAAERVARKAARKVQIHRTPSPVHEHDKYEDFFVPEDLKGNVRENNREAERRADFEEAQIVDIVPGMKRAETFPEELYHTYGTEDTDVPPTKLPWRVPMLGLVTPTPPPMSPALTAERSPEILPVSGRRESVEPEIEDVDPRNIEPKRSPSRVSWGDHEINVYEVITPEYERDSHDFRISSPETTVKDAPTSPLRQSSGVDDDDDDDDKSTERKLNRTSSPVERMTEDRREDMPKGKDVTDSLPMASSELGSKSSPQTRDVMYDMEDRKPSVRSSSPAAQFEQLDSSLSTGSFYQSPFANTVSDLDLPGASKTTTGTTAGEPRDIAAESTEPFKEEQSEERVSKSERRRRERAEAGAEAERMASGPINPEIHESEEPRVPGGFNDASSEINVFDYMVSSNGSTLPSASVLATGGSSILASDTEPEKEQHINSSRDIPLEEDRELAMPKRTETFDEESFIDSFSGPKRAETFSESTLADAFTTPKKGASGYTSDPEMWEKTASASTKGRKSTSRDDDYYSSKSSSSKKRSKRDSQVFNDDDDVKSVASSPAESRSKSKRSSSKRGSIANDEDTGSVVSDTKSAVSEPTSSSKRKSVDSSSTRKKSGWALIGGLIGAAAGNKSDVSTKSSGSERRKSKTSESSDKKRQSSKSKDRERDASVGSEPRRSRSASQSSAPVAPRDESVDEAFVSADEHGQNGYTDEHEDERRVAGETQQESFLATRPDLPTGSDETGSGFGASGLPAESTPLIQTQPLPESGQPVSASRDLDTQAPESASSITIAPLEGPDTSFATPTIPRQRRLSSLRTTDPVPSPSTSSPRALSRFPVSPGIVRTGSLGSPPTAVASSPQTTPRTRQGRPTSSDFRSGKEFRPLYLVERHSATKLPVQEVEEAYPSLPSSRTSSAQPSLENLRAEYSDGDVDTSPQPRSRDVGRRYSWSDGRPKSPEFLDSGAATPTQSTFPDIAKREIKEKPKYEFHSPSELLEDPSKHAQDGVPDVAEGSPLPSAVGTERSTSPVVDDSRPKSSSRSRSNSVKGIGLETGVALVGAAAGAFAAHQLSKNKGESDSVSSSQAAPVSREVEVQEAKDDDFALQPVSSKRSKKDKKKRRKTQDLAEEDDVDTQDPRDIVPSPAAQLLDEPVAEPETMRSHSEDFTQDHEVSAASSSTPAEEPISSLEQPISAAAEADEEAAPSAKKSKKDKKKDKKSKRKESLPLLTTNESASKPGSADNEVDSPSQLQIPPVSAEPLTAIEDDVPRDLSQIPTAMDVTDETAQLDEKTSRASFPFEDSTEIAPVPNSEHEPQSTLFSPSQAPQSSIIEAAFEAACLARGLPEGVGKEMAMGRLLASADEITIKPLENEELQADDKGTFGDDYDISTAQSRDISLFENKNPFGDDFNMPPEEESVSDVLSPKGNFVEVMPPITEASTPGDSSRDLSRLTTAKTKEADPIETDQAEQLSSVTSKKDKKKKKDRMSVLSTEVLADSEAEAQTEGDPAAPIEPDAEESRDLEGGLPLKMPAEPTSTSKSKKDKKAKRKSKATFDEAETSTPDTGTQTPNVEDAAFANIGGEAQREESRDFVAPSKPDVHHDSVAEAALIIAAAQEEVSAKSRTEDAERDLEPEPEPEQPLEATAEDEFAWAPTKKNKDKKSKRRSTAPDNAEPSTPDVGTGTRTLSPTEIQQELEPATDIAPARELPTESAEPSLDAMSKGAQNVQPSQVEPAAEVVNDSKLEQPLEDSVEDEFAWAPAKKGKKDKKSKRKSKVAEEIESETPKTESPVPAAEDASLAAEEPIAEKSEPHMAEEAVQVRDVAMEDAVVPEHSFAPADVQEQAAREQSKAEEVTAADSSEAIVEPKGAEEPADEEWALSAKKSKKDKKARKKSKVVEDFEPETSEATTLPSAMDDSSRGIDEPIATTAASDQLPVVEESTPAEAPYPVEEPAEDEWAVPVKTKKGKKDKKSKKKSLAIDDVESESPATGSQTPAQDGNRDVFSMPLTEEPQPLPIAEEMPSVEAPDELPVVKSPEKLVGEPKVVEKSHNVEEPNPADRFKDEGELDFMPPTKDSKPTETLDQFVSATESKAVDEPPEEDWTVPVKTKKSKKDKKSKRKSLGTDLDDIETGSPATGSQTPAENEYGEAAETNTVFEELNGPPFATEERPLQQTAAEDEWALPIKKSKKEKKSQRQSLVAEDVESAAAEKGEQSLTVPTEEIRELQIPASVPEPVLDNTENNLVAEAELNEEEPVDTPQPAEDEFAWAPAKKTKKDKRSKRKTLDPDSVEPTETSTPASEAQTVERDESSLPTVSSTADFAAGALAGIGATAALSDDKDVPAEDDEWASAPSKKGKKEKKSKKKGKSFSLADEESTPATLLPESERGIPEPEAAAEQARIIDETSTVDEAERQATFTNKLDTEPKGQLEIGSVQSADVDRELQVEDDEWAAPVKKSKKDKKKKKQSLAAFEEDQLAQEASQSDAKPEEHVTNSPVRQISEVAFPVGLETSHVDDVTGHYFSMLKEYTPLPGAPDNKVHRVPIPATEEIPSHVENDDLAPEKDVGIEAAAKQVVEAANEHEDKSVPEPEADLIIPNVQTLGNTKDIEQQGLSSTQEHDFPTVSEVAHVDDVVSFHYGMLKNYQPKLMKVSEDKDVGELIPPSVPGAATDSVAAERSLLQESRREAPVEDINMTDEPQSITDNTLSVEDLDVTGSEHKPNTVEASAATEEDLYPIISKKGKKDKKKKRKSAVEDFEGVSNDQSKDVSESEGMPVAAAVGVGAAALGADSLYSTRDATAEQSTIADEAVEKDVFPPSSKKSKKDKKKKRGSNFEDSDTVPSTSTDELTIATPAIETEPILETQRDIVETSALAEQEENFTISGKKSKKDKKKKKSLLPWADGEESASLPTETSTPAEQLDDKDAKMEELASAAEEMTSTREQKADSVTEPSAIAPDTTTDKPVELERHMSRSIPGGWDMDEEEPMPQEASIPLEEPTKAADISTQGREMATGEVADEPTPEEEDVGYVAKKSKKDKKKGGRKSEAFIEEPESREIQDAKEIIEAAQAKDAVDEQSKEIAEEEEWGFSSKKSKKVKKNKREKSIVEVLPESVQEVQSVTPPEMSQESSSREAGGNDDLAEPVKKSKKDKKSRRQSTRNVELDDQPEKPAPFPLNEPVHVNDVTGHHHGLLRDYQPAPGAPDNKMTTSREPISEPTVSHVDDVTGHYFDMLRNYQPAAGAPDNKPVALAGDLQEPTAEFEQPTHYVEQDIHDERATSPVSDEETRRARRARRKASPVYRGEEPEDLPGNRSLTPPAEHDDMMTTALGVAAGLGLTGTAPSSASARPDMGEARGVARDQPPPTTEAPGWSFANLDQTRELHQIQRDSGIQFADSPTLPQDHFDAQNRDSGYVRSPDHRQSWPEGSSREIDLKDTSSRPPRPQSPTSSAEDLPGKRSKRVSRDMDARPTEREPSPVQSTSKDRSSRLFNSSPAAPRIDEHGETPRQDSTHLSGPITDIHRTPSIHGHHRSREEVRALSLGLSESAHVSESRHEQPVTQAQHQSIFGPQSAHEGQERGFSPPKTPLHTISEHSQDNSPSLRRPRQLSDVGSPDNKRIQRQESDRNLRDAAGIVGAVAAAGAAAIPAMDFSRDDRPASRAKSLGKSKANTKSSRSLRRATFDQDIVPSSSTHDPFEGKGKEAARDMSDVYDGHGEYPGSPMSPTRPPSMRKRQSMQQIRDLETRLDQLAAENRTLAEAKINAERHLEDLQLEQHKSGYAGQEALETANLQLREKDEAIAKLQQELEEIRQDHARLTEANAGLSDAHDNLRTEHEQRYSQLEDQHAEAHQNWQESSRELETLRGQHAELSGGMEEVVRHQIDSALADKNAEIERLRADLQVAKEKINELQQQILSGGGGDDILDFKDEDYFENACQSLCQHVQQWVLRFSKFSDTVVCRTTNQIRDEKLIDRFDLSILDGSDVDVYLTDRIKRRDVFMSVVMTMIFEYIFTRYLFGMDRDQRQTLKKLEKNLTEVGPPSAVHQWRAITLTLLSKRQAFKASCENDTEAVVLQIYDTLSRFLPPPQNLQAQVQESLRNVMRTAVNLSIEMRTQKAEYIMLPPLQPEYDTNGDLTRKVYFNASLMNERSGETTSNDELEAQQAVVRMVLFPLVVKKGNDDGEGEEEIVVCPAQVLVARPDRKSKANSGRVVSAQSDRMSVDQMSRANASRHSLAPSGTMDMSNVI